MRSVTEKPLLFIQKKGFAITQAVICRSLTKKPRVRSRSSPNGILSDKKQMG